MQCIRQKYAGTIMSIYLKICWSTYVDLWLINHNVLYPIFRVSNYSIKYAQCLVMYHTWYIHGTIHTWPKLYWDLEWTATRHNGGCWKKCHIQASATCHPPEREHRAGSNRPCWPLHEAIVNWFIGLSFCCIHKLFGCFKFMRKIASASMYW